MGKRKLNSSINAMNAINNNVKHEEPTVEKTSNYHQYNEENSTKIKNKIVLKDNNNKKTMNKYIQINSSVCLIWILVAIIIFLVNKLYLNNNNNNKSSLTYTNFKSFPIINYEHIIFPTFDNNNNNDYDNKKSQSEVSKLNKNIEIKKNDFNMVIFHEEEKNNETRQGKKKKINLKHILFFRKKIKNYLFFFNLSNSTRSPNRYKFSKKYGRRR
jgi:hypothetical protein